MTIRKWGNETIVADAHALVFANSDKGLDVTTLSDGSYIVSWIQQDGDTVEAQKFDASGKPIGDVFEIGASVTGADKTSITLTALADGGFAAGFTNSANAGDSWYEQFDADGNVVRTTQWDQSSTALAENSESITRGGSYIFLAESDAFGDGDIYLQMRNTGTGTAGAINGGSTFFKLNSDLTAGSQHSVNIAFSEYNNDLAAVWIDSQTNTFRLRIFSVDATLAQPTVVTDTASIDVAGAVSGMDFGPQVVAMANGGFVVVWHDNSGNDTPDKNSYSVHAKMYAADGTALSGEITVNSMFENLQARPDVLALNNGGFLVTWDDSATGDRNISGQMFDAFGDRVGGQFTVNTHSSGSDYDSRITELDDGRIVVVWSNQVDGFIRQQIIDPRDGVIDGTAEADTLYGHDALGDIISGGEGADAILGLSGNDQVYGGEGADAVSAGKGDDTVFGGVGNDDMKGNSGDDTLYGETGSDDLLGGKGADSLTGGAGNDAFVFNALTDSGDTIADFSSTGAGNNDRVEFDGAAFGGLAAGSITANMFQSSAAAVAQSGNVRFLYETDTGILRYDADGQGGDAATIMATLQAGATMTFNDILIV